MFTITLFSTATSIKHWKLPSLARFKPPPPPLLSRPLVTQFWRSNNNAVCQADGDYWSSRWLLHFFCLLFYNTRRTHWSVYHQCITSVPHPSHRIIIVCRVVTSVPTCSLDCCEQTASVHWIQQVNLAKSLNERETQCFFVFTPPAGSVATNANQHSFWWDAYSYVYLLPTTMTYTILSLNWIYSLLPSTTCPPCNQPTSNQHADFSELSEWLHMKLNFFADELFGWSHRMSS